MNRLILFETIVGSHLYGTNRPESDMDYLGVFLHDHDEFFNLQNPADEWSMNTKTSDSLKNTKDDVDRKYYSLKKFFNMLGQGQSGALEMLFSPENLWITRGSIWQKITENKNLFISQNSIKPFIGFATAQAHKATLKGDNLNLIRRIITKMSNGIDLHATIMTRTYPELDKTALFFGENLDTWTDPTDMLHIRIAGRDWPVTASLGLIFRHLKELESKYGKRSEAAAQYGYDYKSLLHAYRLLFQAKEIISTGNMTFPRPSEEVKFLNKVRDGKHEADYFDEIEQKLTELKSIDSSLPKEVDWSKINDFYRSIMFDYYGVYK